jgi:hypothetical protein
VSSRTVPKRKAQPKIRRAARKVINREIKKASRKAESRIKDQIKTKKAARKVINRESLKGASRADNQKM